MDLFERLETADAPPELVREVRDGDLDLEAAWERCARPDHRVWLAACAGVPIERVIEASALSVYLAEERSPGALAAVGEALDLAVSGGAADALVHAATACERIAAGGVGDYRSPTGPGTAERARAAALVARAAEALIAGEARREAARLEQARSAGAMLGIGMQAVLRPEDGDTRLDPVAAAADPAQGMFLYCIAACAQATRECVEALAREGAPRDAALRDVDAAVREALALGDSVR